MRLPILHSMFLSLHATNLKNKYIRENTDPTRRVKAPEGENCDFKAFTDSAGLFLKF